MPAPAKLGAALRVLAPGDRVPHAFTKLALLSLGLHGLLLTGAGLWPTPAAETPARPEPVTLVTLAAPQSLHITERVLRSPHVPLCLYPLKCWMRR